MCCGTGQTIPYEEIFPTEMKKGRAELMRIALANATNPATPLPKDVPWAAGTNQARKNPLDMYGVMFKGKPYSSSKPRTYGQSITETMPGLDEDDPGDNRGWECALHSPPLRFLTEDLYNAHMSRVHGTGPGDDPITDDPKDRPIDVRSGYFDPYSQDSWM